MGNSPRYVGFLDPPYNATLTDDSGNALNLTGCTSNSFTLTMLNPNTGLFQQGVGVWTITNALAGQASYQWTTNDMATAGPWWIYSTVKLPSEPNPREFDPELIYILPGTVGAGAAPPGVLPAPAAAALFFNVRDYGALGDGTDQTTAITNAINAANTAGGGAVFFPRGIYLATGISQTGVNNITLAGTGRASVLQMKASTTNNVINLTSCSNWTIRDLTIDCNGANQVQGTNEDLQCGIHLVSCTFCTISNVRTLNSLMSGIRLGTFAAGTGTCTDCAITNCEIYNNPATYVAGTSDPDQGIGIWNSQRITVTNCTVNNGGWGGIVLTYSDYCTVVGCTSYANVYRIGGPTNGGQGIALEGARWCTITGNVCYNNNVHGIHLENDPATSARNCLGCVLADNTCYGNIEGIFIGHASRCALLGNTIYNSSQYGLELTANADTCLLQGNISEANTLIGFWIKASNSEIVGNIARSNSQQGFLVQGGATNVLFAENYAVSNSQAGFDIRGTTNCAIVGNVAASNLAQGFIIQNDGGTVNTLGILSNNVSDGNSNEGLILLNATGFAICGNFASGNHGSGGLDCRGVQFSSITGNTIANNSGAGITLEDNSTTFCLWNIVSGNNCSDTQGGSHTQTYGIRETGTSNNNRITNNVCNNNVTAQIASVGAATVVRFNTGFVTESHGNASITTGNTSVVVTHGLGVTPTLEQISVTPQTSLGSAAFFWVSNATSTQFTINLNVNPAGTVTFGWVAQVGY